MGMFEYDERATDHLEVAGWCCGETRTSNFSSAVQTSQTSTKPISYSDQTPLYPSLLSIKLWSRISFGEVMKFERERKFIEEVYVHQTESHVTFLFPNRVIHN